jgi:hypothetical protein
MACCRRCGIVIFPFTPRHTTSHVTNLSPGHNTPAADAVISVSSEQGLAIGGPGEGDTLRLPALLADLDVLGLELVDLALLLEVEDDDGGRGGGAEPVAVGREDKGVDLVSGGERVEVLGLVQVPEHGGSVLTTGGAERAIGGDGDGVDVAGVTDVVGLDAARGEFPDLCKVSNLLDGSILSTRGFNNWVSGIGDCLSHRRSSEVANT